MQKRVRERIAQLEDTNRELEAFTYSVSHDLRAPLRAMDGFTRILHEEHASEFSPEARHDLELVRANAQHLSALVDDLLDFSRAGRQPLTKVHVAMTSLVQQVLSELELERRVRAVEITLRELPSAEADPQLFKQVWVNLLSNALKFTRPRSPARIEIGAVLQGDRIAYYMKDNGVGFDMRYVEKLFGVFQRLHSVEEFEGTGVGLAIVARIVERHGGQVWATGTPDKGATFYFTLAP